MVSADDDSIPCDFCDSERAVLFCRADSARLCLACDREVHAANTVSSRHNRSLLCDCCASAPATIFCPTPPHRLVLCSSCDFSTHQIDHRHDRRALDPFTGCPAGAVLAASLGLGDDKDSPPNTVEEDWAWEVPLVFNWDDLILQTTTTTPFHGFQAMGIPPPPKDKKSSCGKREKEIHQQIRKLIISETDGFHYSEENAPALEFKSLQQENLELGKLDNDYAYTPVFVEVPSCEISNPPHNLTDNQMAISNPVEISQAKQIGSSSLASETFVDSTIETASYPNLSKDELHDRSSVISRYKEKRKTRRYDKLIRYESRKARADSRVRIKGRFAKANHVANP